MHTAQVVESRSTLGGSKKCPRVAQTTGDVTNTYGRGIDVLERSNQSAPMVNIRGRA
jgi:hypothetical protein